MEQTAVEWLKDTLYPYLNKEDKEYTDALLDKEMEKEKMIDFAFNFYYDFCNKTGVPFNLISENRTNVEDYYYNRTFKSE